MLRSSNDGTVTQSSDGLGGCTDGPQRVGRDSEGVMTASEGVVSVSELIVSASKKDGWGLRRGSGGFRV